MLDVFHAGDYFPYTLQHVLGFSLESYLFGVLLGAACYFGPDPTLATATLLLNQYRWID